MVARMADEILTSVADGIATITMNRPAQRNAMNRALLDGLRKNIDDLDHRKDVRVIVVRGAGPAFCAGMDLKEMEARGGAADPEADVVEVLQRVERAKHPTIAMVHGDAIAGGCELALHCDLRVMADTARIGMPLARIGLIVPFKLGQKLVEIIGPAHTRHLMFTGRPIDAHARPRDRHGAPGGARGRHRERHAGAGPDDRRQRAALAARDQDA